MGCRRGTRFGNCLAELKQVTSREIAKKFRRQLHPDMWSGLMEVRALVEELFKALPDKDMLGDS